MESSNQGVLQTADQAANLKLKHFNGFFDKISSFLWDQEIKVNLDSDRVWFYSPYNSDYPLIGDKLC